MEIIEVESINEVPELTYQYTGKLEAAIELATRAMKAEPERVYKYRNTHTAVWAFPVTDESVERWR